MEIDPLTGLPISGGGGEHGAPAPRAFTPELEQELNQLRSYRENAEGFLTRLEPHKARVQKLLDDQDAARVFDDSLTAYQTLRQAQKPKLPPEWNPEENPFLKRMMGVADKVDAWDKTSVEMTERQASEANTRTVQEAYTVSEALIKTNPTLADNDFAGIKAIAAFAQSAKVPFKQAAEMLEPVYSRAAAPPPSLRPNAGRAGVPEESKRPNEDQRSFYEIAKDRLEAASRGRAS